METPEIKPEELAFWEWLKHKRAENEKKLASLWRVFDGREEAHMNLYNHQSPAEKEAINELNAIDSLESKITQGQSITMIKTNLNPNSKDDKLESSLIDGYLVYLKEQGTADKKQNR